MMPSPVGRCHYCGDQVYQNCTGDAIPHHCRPRPSLFHPVWCALCEGVYETLFSNVWAFLEWHRGPAGCCQQVQDMDTRIPLQS